MNFWNPGRKKNSRLTVHEVIHAEWSIDGLSWIDMVDPELLFANYEFHFVVVT